MLKLKKFILSLFIAVPILALSFGEWLKTWPIKQDFWWESTAIIEGKTVGDIDEWSKSFTDKLGWIIKLPQKSNYTNSLNYVMDMIQIVINWLLGMLAFIALIYMIYCGLLVFSSWSDNKNATKGKKWIWTAAIALTGIWVSWLIISMILRFINYITAE